MTVKPDRLCLACGCLIWNRMAHAKYCKRCSRLMMDYSARMAWIRKKMRGCT